MAGKLICRVFLFLMVCSTAVAQDLRGHFMPFGLGYSFEVVKDASLSPVSYSGSLGNIKLGYIHQNDNWLSSFDLFGIGGFQKPDINREGNLSRTITFGGRLTYSLSYKVNKSSDWSVFAGLTSTNIWDFRIHNRYNNSSSNYVGLFSMGLIGTVQKPFEFIGQNWAVQYSLGLPVGAYYLRPGYIKPFFNDGIGSKGFAFWGDYFQLDSRTELIWLRPGGNQIRLSYYWEYAQLDPLNKVQLGGHHLTISTVLKF